LICSSAPAAVIRRARATVSPPTWPVQATQALPASSTATCGFDASSATATSRIGPRAPAGSIRRAWIASSCAHTTVATPDGATATCGRAAIPAVAVETSNGAVHSALASAATAVAAASAAAIVRR
jgi:hypothetical protein